MELTRQVVNLDLSKKLKSAGYEQEGIWWWKPYLHCGKEEQVEWIISNNSSGFGIPIVAPTLYELLAFAIKRNILEADSLLEIRHINTEYLAKIIIKRLNRQRRT